MAGKYCRYCNHIVVKHGKCSCPTRGRDFIPINNVKWKNKCPDFDLNPIDALGINTVGYIENRGRKGRRVND